MTYRTNDGQPIIATEPEAVVRELHKRSHTPSESDRAFMRETAARVQNQFNKRVRFNRPEHFVTDLIQVGLLIEEEEEAAE